MSSVWEYHEIVKRLNGATVAVFVLVVTSLILAAGAEAQINAAPPSVTSLGFGGHPISGISPSVTSVGPLGFTFNPAFPNSRPFFGVNPVQNGHHHHHRGSCCGLGGIGYAVPYYGYYDNQEDVENYPPEEQYNGGPTIFDRRGPGRAPRPPEPASDRGSEQAELPAPVAQPETTPAPDQPHTVLVFKDGHQVEVSNYAIVGNTLYDLTEGRRHKIALSDLDLQATEKQNDDRGIDFQLPSGAV